MSSTSFDVPGPGDFFGGCTPPTRDDGLGLPTSPGTRQWKPDRPSSRILTNIKSFENVKGGSLVSRKNRRDRSTWKAGKARRSTSPGRIVTVPTETPPVGVVSEWRRHPLLAASSPCNRPRLPAPPPLFLPESLLLAVQRSTVVHPLVRLPVPFPGLIGVSQAGVGHRQEEAVVGVESTEFDTSLQVPDRGGEVSRPVACDPARDEVKRVIGLGRRGLLGQLHGLRGIRRDGSGSVASRHAVLFDRLASCLLARDSSIVNEPLPRGAPVARTFPARLRPCHPSGSVATTIAPHQARRPTHAASAGSGWIGARWPPAGGTPRRTARPGAPRRGRRRGCQGP